MPRPPHHQELSDPLGAEADCAARLALIALYCAKI